MAGSTSLYAVFVGGLARPGPPATLSHSGVYCPNCGQQTDENARFCRHCGHQLTSSAAPALSEPPAGYLRSNVSAMDVAEARAVVYAGFWRRVAAAIVDSILVTIVSTLVGFVIGFFFGLVAPSSTDSASALAGLIGLLIGILYYPVLESSSAQATWGKRALNIVVTDTDGRRVSFLRALGRNLAKIISALLLCLGYLMVAFTSRKQGLHDLIASTLVVVRRST
jgi:uncharacterized RDD family membrane protein YckC